MGFAQRAAHADPAARQLSQYWVGLATWLVRTRIRGSRKSGKAMAYEHSLEVGRILARYGYETSVQLAGYLHDLLEDSETSAAELREDFPEASVRIVELVSHDKAIEGSVARWAVMIGNIARLPSTDPEKEHALAVKIADAISNLNDVEGLKPNKRNFYIHVKASLLLEICKGEVIGDAPIALHLRALWESASRKFPDSREPSPL